MSKVVFVGNVPYNMGEEQLIDVFKTVGQVVGFRLVYDRETGKPKGYGFCEFADHETASSAVRNLNNVDVGGRPLRIDLADSDPFLEGKTTVRGEILDGGETRAQWRERERRERDRDGRLEPNSFLKQLPPGTPPAPGKTSLDAISHTLATMNPSQLTEVLAQMKAFVINHSDHARALLVAHPQLAYALFQALLLNKIVDSAILQRMLAATHVQNDAPLAQQGPPSVPPPTQMPLVLGQSHTHTPTPPAPSIPTGYADPYQHQMPPQVTQPASYYRPPPPTQPPQPTPVAHVSPPVHVSVAPPVTPNLPPNMDPGQRDMILQVLALTPDKIAALPVAERDAIQQLRTQFLGAAAAALPR